MSRGLAYSWTKQNRLRLLDRLADGLAFKKGMFCVFVPLTPFIAVKLYQTLKSRNLGYRRQQRAHKLGRGPRAGDCFSLWTLQFELGGPSRKRVYGYLTQRARAVGYVSNAEISRLRDDVGIIGLTNDEYFALPNMGRIRRRLVCVDFV